MVKDINKVYPGNRFSYGFFTNVIVVEVSPEEIVFEDSFFNKRHLKIHDFLTSARMLTTGPVEVKEKKEAEIMPEEEKDQGDVQGVKPAKASKKVEKKVPAKAEEPVKVAKSVKTAGNTPMGWLTIKDAAEKYGRSKMVLLHHATKTHKIEAKQLSNGVREVTYVKEEDVATLYGNGKVK